MSRCYICMKLLPKSIFNPIGLCEECIKEEPKNVKQNTHQAEPQREIHSVVQKKRNVRKRGNKSRTKKQVIGSKKDGKFRTERERVEEVINAETES